MANATKTKQAQPAKNRPVKEHRSGAIRATVWLNSSDNGEWYSINITRSYKTAQGDWKEISQFNRDDLLVVPKLSELCYYFIASEQHV